MGYKSGKLKSLEGYAVDQPFANGWFCYSCNLTIHGELKFNFFSSSSYLCYGNGFLMELLANVKTF